MHDWRRSGVQRTRRSYRIQTNLWNIFWIFCMSPENEISPGNHTRDRDHLSLKGLRHGALCHSILSEFFVLCGWDGDL
jgi:hypothetical protein